MLQCVAVCCSALQCVAVRCSGAVAISVCCNITNNAATHRVGIISVMQSVAVRCSVVQCGAVAISMCCNTTYIAAIYRVRIISVLQSVAVRCSVVQLQYQCAAIRNSGVTFENVWTERYACAMCLEYSRHRKVITGICVRPFIESQGITTGVTVENVAQTGALCLCHWI